jgi:hypothetical protein
MAGPAIFFLALHAPVTWLGSQFLLAAEPLVAPFVGRQLAHDLALVLEDPASVQALVRRLESVHGERPVSP